MATTSAATTVTDFTSDYRLILEEFIKSSDQQYAYPSSLTKEQRAIVHKLATELNLQHQTKGNWKKRILYITKIY